MMKSSLFAEALSTFWNAARRAALAVSAVGRDARKLFFLLGMSLAIVAASAPDIIPLISGVGAENVWTPIGDFNHRYSDAYYYASNVKEILDGRIIPEWPTNSGGMSFEASRLAPMLLGAAPGVLWNDVRFWYPVGNALSAALFFLSLFFVAKTVTRDATASTIIALMTYFTSGLWSAVPPDIFTFEGGNWPVAAGRLADQAARLLFVGELSLTSQHFRYMHLSLSMPILLGYGALLLSAAEAPRRAMLWALVPFGVVVALSYPTHAYIGYLLLIAVFLTFAFLRNVPVALRFFAVGVATIAALLILRIPWLIAEVYTDNPVVGETHVASAMTGFRPPGFDDVLLFLINKYTLTAGLAVVALRQLPDRRVVWLSIIGFAFLFSAVYLIDLPSLQIRRFHDRGIDTLWYCLVLSLMWATLKPISSLHGAIARKTVAGVALMLVVTAVAGLTWSGVRNSSNGTRAMDREVWRAYAAINEHVAENEIVLTGDWIDTYYTPLVTSADVYYSDIQLSGRSAEVEFGRLIAAWKALGVGHDDFIAMVENSIPADRRHREPLRQFMRNPASLATERVPFGDRTDIQSLSIARYVLRYQNLRSHNGIAISADNETVTAEFLNYASRLWRETSPCDENLTGAVKYILLSEDVAMSAINACFGAGAIIWQNDKRRLYKVSGV